MMLRISSLAGCLCLVLYSTALSQPAASRDPAGLRRLQAAAGGAAKVSVNPATGGVRFVQLPAGARGLGSGAATTLADKQKQSQAFFRDYASLLGLSDAAGLRFESSSADRLGETHLTWKQYHGSVPVFGAVVKTHFDRAHQLKAVNGTAVPDITVNPEPSVAVRRAASVARAAVAEGQTGTGELRIGRTTLYVYRSGLARGVPGENHLAWEVEVTDGARVRELVYVDAHSAKIVDRITGIQDGLRRRAYDGHDLAFVPQNYPHAPYWQEGQTLPTASTEANNMIFASKEVYDFFNQAFGRDSFDDNGATLDAIFDRGYSCPNASWNGVFISFCPGFTTDDVTAHEWGHAYTEYTHGLIYQWQPGALNESYSDIWGEVVDLINNRGTDDDGSRTEGACSAFSPPVARLRVNTPPTLAGTYLAQSAQFGPPLSETGVTGNVVAAADPANASGPSTADACSPLTNAAQIAGSIALVDRGTCTFVTKVLNAQAAGAVGVIVANNVSSGLPGMGGLDPTVTIPSIGILQADGAAIRSALATDVVNSTLLAQPGSDQTVRWLVGEDIGVGDGTGAIRDMSNPNCHGNPAKVTDVAYYVCSAGDQGGVHTNSGVPNHAFALLVDGGTYNGTQVAPIGLTKAAHVYFRAQSDYQVPASDFADHADALEQSCSDLVGQPLDALTGGPSGETITAADCAEVSNAIAAVELRTPAPCTFAPLLRQNPPPLCSPATTTGIDSPIFLADFEADASGWTATHVALGATFTHRDWTRVTDLPDGRAGFAFFAPDPDASCAAGNDDTGLLRLTSPPITLPGGTDFARATFEHWVATEPDFDGGTLRISVNGGAWQPVPSTDYTFNGYNLVLLTAAQGNTNPLGGQPAWSGTDAGTVDGSTWGRTHVNIARFARAGDTIRLRWEFGTDLCAGRVGWYLDNVNVFSCTPNVPSITIDDATATESDSLGQQMFFTVRLSGATIQAVAVRYSIADGTAQHGNDFLPVTDGTIVIPAGATSARIGITLKGDIVPEPDEVFFVNLSGAVNATIGDSQAQGTIVNDDSLP